MIENYVGINEPEIGITYSVKFLVSLLLNNRKVIR
jgi:hypothetical protein